MTRTAAERANDVRRILEAARRVRVDPALGAELVRTTGLSPEGVGLALAEHLEVLGDGLDLVAECVRERSVGEVGGEHDPREQDHTWDGSSFRASTSSTKESTTGCAGSIA